MSTKVSKSKTDSRRGELIVLSHRIKLVLRSLFFLGALAAYLLARVHGDPRPFGVLERSRLLFYGIPICFALEMLLFRIIPLRLDALGSRKQRKRDFRPIEGAPRPSRGRLSHGLLPFTLVWVALNLLIGILALTGVIARGVLFLVFLFYSVCDIVCILFFCPIRRWFLKNRCCTTCRIYNWDYAMMCTPLLFLPHPITYALFGISLYILLEWEIAFLCHPERFASACNASLACEACTEHLCRHNVELRRFVICRRRAKAQAKKK